MHVDAPGDSKVRINVTKWELNHTLEVYSSSSGSTYVSSSSAYFSISMNRLTLKVCLASKGCPWMVASARLASSALLKSTNMKLDKH